MNQEYKHIILEKFDYYWQIWLNRPEKHNALNAQMIDELSNVLEQVDETVTRFVVLRGKGKSFCAGADISWMKNASDMSFEENKKDASKAANLFSVLHHLPIPVIAFAHGNVYGGALGLLAASDLVFGETKSVFSFSEVKIGLSPSTIMPYVLQRLSSPDAKELILTAKVFDVHEALQKKLVDRVFEQNQVENIINSYLGQFKNTAPGAVKESKRLINWLKGDINEHISNSTIESLAKRRISNEAVKGFDAFLNKKKVSWD